MANYAEEPLTKVTVNLFTKDVEYLRERAPERWSLLLRRIVRAYINNAKHIEGETYGE